MILKIKAAVYKLLLIMGQFMQFVLWHFPISIIALIGLYFGFYLLRERSQDTIVITNYAFGIVSALSAISFAYYKTIQEDNIKLRIKYCGERFFHSAILFLVASLIKYFVIIESTQHALGNNLIISGILKLINVFPGGIYLGSLINGIAALRELNSILYARKKPGEELLKFF